MLPGIFLLPTSWCRAVLGCTRGFAQTSANTQQPVCVPAAAAAAAPHLNLLAGECLPVLTPNTLHELHALIAAGVVQLWANILQQQTVQGAHEHLNFLL